MLRKAFSVEGGSRMGIRDQGGPEIANLLICSDRIGFLPDVMGLIPARTKITDGKKNSHHSRIIPLELSTPLFPDESENPLAHQPENDEMQKNNYRIYKARKKLQLP